MATKQDERILALLRSNDPKERDQGFLIIYNDYFKVIKNFVIKHNGNITDAEDLFQDSLVVLYSNLLKDSFELRCTVYTYLYSVCRNLWFKRIRDNKRVPLVIEDDDALLIDESDMYMVEKSEENQILYELLNQLGKKCKTILGLFYFENKSLKEISAKLGYKNYTVVKNLKSRCMRTLRKMAFDNDAFIEINNDSLK